jgi:hypothetical protein
MTMAAAYRRARMLTFAVTSLLVGHAVCARAGTLPATAVTPQPTRHSSLEGTPGYTPPVDPDSEAVITGHRKAPPVSQPFAGGAVSVNGVARALLQSVAAKDRARLDGLCITRSEFSSILWPEFPQSRPITGATADDGWYFLARRNAGGVSRALNEYAGQRLTLVRVERAQPVERYRNFALYRGLTIVAKDSTGALVRLDDLRTVAERKGVFKIYSMRD